ncbi:MAG TPA: hypothetical protein VHX60_10525 [Acidobacteriaceae bacterium]|jgi:hypothetical protein|nr:hypothetical protein [Acidobacteriaceae bacterium]
MLRRVYPGALGLLLLLQGCAGRPPGHLTYQAPSNEPRLLAVYEGWFGLPSHIQVGYSSHDADTVRQQIQKARGMGLAGFVVDWYANRVPYIDKSYALVQKEAAAQGFQVAMMLDQPERGEGTEQTIAELTQFRDKYLAPGAEGANAYLTWNGQPLIFIFPHGTTDWGRVHAALQSWNPRPLLIEENLPGPEAPHAKDFDGFYVWLQAGPAGGQQWGEQHLRTFYQTMVQQYPNKIMVGGAWARFDDSRASWGRGRFIDARCGETLKATFNLWRGYVPTGQTIPLLLVETWNDYEEGTEIETGLPTCHGQPPPASLADEAIR